MKVLVDIHALEKERTGKPFFTLNLIHGFANLHKKLDIELVFACKKYTDLGFSLPENFSFLELGEGTKRFQWNLAKEVRSIGKYDLFWSATSFIPSSVSKIPTVSFVYDFASFQKSEFKKNRKAEFFEKLLIRRVLKNSDALVAISESTKNEMVEKFPHIEHKSFVVPGAPREFPDKRNDDEVMKKYSLQKDSYILYVGTIEPRKNISRMISAFHTAFFKERRENDIPKLVIAGKKGWFFEEVFQRVEDLEISDHVEFLGYTPDEDLPPLFRGCRFFSYVPFYEGFGLPVLEAASFGKPSLTSNTSSLPEAVGPCGILVDPESEEEIATQLKILWDDETLRKKLESKTRVWKTHYTKEQNTKKLYEIFRTTIKSRKRLDDLIGR